MDKLFEKVIELANIRHIHVVAQEYGAGAVACTALSFAGGLLGGPVGLAVGGFLGGLTAYGMSRWANHPISMDECIKKYLSDEQKEHLHKWILDAIRKHYPSEYTDPMALIDNSKFVQKVVIEAVQTYLTNEMNYKITE